LIFSGSFSTLFRTDGLNTTTNSTSNSTTVTLDEVLQAYPGDAPQGTITTGFLSVPHPSLAFERFNRRWAY
jgi:hypothetical protein